MEAQELIDDGYKEYSVSYMDAPWAKRMFQKWVYIWGVKSFAITVYFPNSPNGGPTSRAQFRMSDGTALNLEYWTVDSLSKMELLFIRLFQASGAVPGY